MTQKQKKKRIILVLLILVVAAVTYLMFSFGKIQETETASQEPATTESSVDEKSGEPLATLFFASDYQPEITFDEPKETLSKILQQANADSKKINGVIFCGDYSNVGTFYNYQIKADDSIEEIKSVVAETYPDISENRMLFVQGNHDAMSDAISDSGLHEYNNYLVYIINTQSDFPWSQGTTMGSRAKVKAASEALQTCLEELKQKKETRPLIIAGHVPLHYSARTSSHHTTGDNLYASLIFDVVNTYGKDLDIIYLFGHNHSKGWDCYLGGSCVFKKPEDKIIIPTYEETSVTSNTFDEKTLNFTYLNAGYIGYYLNCSTSEINNGTKEQYDAADMTQTGTVAEIYPDRIVLTRYGTAGSHSLGAKGCADPYSNFIDKDLIDKQYYSINKQSPQTIQRKNNKN